MLFLLALLAAAAVSPPTHAATPYPNPFPHDLQCNVYLLAYQFAQKIQPNMTDIQKEALSDALQLVPNCIAAAASTSTTTTPTPTPALPKHTIYVDATHGKDSNDGTFTTPLHTLAAAVTLSRTQKTTTQRTTIALRKGIHYLTETLLLAPQDSHLTIQNYPDETVEISGAVPLPRLKWHRHNTGQDSHNIWSTNLNTVLPSGMHTFTGLRYNGKRAIRARWPNGDPETQLFPDGWSAATVKWLPPQTFSIPAESIVVATPNRSQEGPCTSVNGYCNYVTGVGGACEGYGFQPPSGYWCNANPPRGQTYSTSFPSGLSYNASLAFEGRTWPSFKPNRSIINAFRQGHWFSYVFLIDQYNSTTHTMNWTWGGFQGGEGCDTAAEWNVENVFEELDSENEWYYDEDSQALYWWYNETGPPPSDLRLEATRLTELIRIQGTTAGTTAGSLTTIPVVDVLLQGLTLTGTATTYLEPHGLPSDGGGDWALARTAAVNLEGTEHVNIEHCLFERIDGNGVLISGYNRNATLRANEFHWVGENGVVSWG